MSRFVSSELRKVVIVGGAFNAVALTLTWIVEGSVFRFPRVLHALVVPAIIGSVAYAVTLVALERRGLGGKGPAAQMLLVWLVMCPLLVGVLASVFQLMEPLDAGLAMVLEARGQLWLSWSKTSQAMTRALAGVLGASWLLLRALLRALPQRGEPG